MHNSRSTASVALFLVGLAIAAGLAGIAFHNLVADGPFAWHVTQPRYTQGLAELLVLSALSAVALRYLRTGGMLLATIAMLFYARRQNVDYALGLAFVYASGILAVGTLIRAAIPSFRDADAQANHPASMFCEKLVLGIVGFSLVQWLLALTGIGYLATIRSSWLVAAVAVAAAFALRFFQRGRGDAAPTWPLSKWLLSSSRGDLFFSSACFLLIFAAMAALAKTNYAADSDALWYGLRPDRVLFYGGSLFAKTNLAMQIHYYPKLFELLTTPLSDTGDNSTIIAFTVFCWFAFVLACAALAATITPDRRVQAALALTAGTTPAMIGIACTTKGDILAAALVIIALTKLSEFFRTWQLRHAVIVFCALVLASLARLSVLPYVGLGSVFLAVGYLYAVYRGHLPANPLQRPNRAAWLVAVAAVGVFVLVSLRTYLLAGIPIIAPSQLEHLALVLGMSKQFPVANSIDWSAVPIPPLLPMVGDFLFRPMQLPHVLFGWTGNAWLVLAGLALAAGVYPAWRTRLDRADYASLLALLCTGAIFFVLLATVHVKLKGADGNYYIVPITALLAAFLMLCRKAPAALIAGVAMGAAILGIAIFMMTALWWSGTRAFDWSLGRNPRDNAEFVQATIEHGSLDEVYSRTSGCGPNVAVIGALTKPSGYTLPFRYEPLKEIDLAYVGSAATLADYFRATNVDLVILPKVGAAEKYLTAKSIWTPKSLVTARAAAALRLARANSPVVAHSENFDYFAFSEIGKRCLTADTTAPPDPCLQLSGASGTDAASAVAGKPAAPAHPVIWFDPDAMKVCEKHGKVAVHWDASALPGVGTVEVSVANPKGDQVFARGGPVGTQATGPWMHAGSRMMLRNYSNGGVLGCATVAELPCDQGK